MTYINKFTSTSAFEAAKDELNKLNHFVAYDAEAQKINLKNMGRGDALKGEFGDILFHDRENDKLVITKNSEWSIESYPADKYYPLGIVVVPVSHNVYGNGKCGVMSLLEMSCYNPNTGTNSHQGIYWGNHGYPISELTDYNCVCSVGSGEDIHKEVQTTASNGYLPLDNSFGITNPYDTDTYYTEGEYIPSPYNEDNSRNAEYYRTSEPSSPLNALSDFSGKSNTEIILSHATAQSDWETADTITNESYDSFYPAACCCWRFCPEGTKQGDWYLPAMGELGYIAPKFNETNKTIEKIIDAYGHSVGIANDNSFYANSIISSSEYSEYYTVSLNCYSGSVSYHDKDSNGYVRAFIMI